MTIMGADKLAENTPNPPKKVLKLMKVLPIPYEDDV